jgi:hypothetical protein
MMSEDLVAFLNARLDEDEARALKAREDWDADHVRYEWEDLPDEVFAHARTHDPERVLREVEAKRAIIAEHGRSRRDISRCRVCTAIAGTGATRFRAPCPTLLALAAVWRAHPDYGHTWDL